MGVRVPSDAPNLSWSSMNPLKQNILNLFNDDTEWRKKQIVAFISNVINPYEDRLEVWKKTPPHLTTNDPYIFSSSAFEEKYGELDWFDEFYKNKHEFIDLRLIGEQLEDKEYPHTDQEGNPWSAEKIRDFYEACMQAGFHGFTLDW
jgi:hypothetical protein